MNQVDRKKQRDNLRQIVHQQMRSMNKTAGNLSSALGYRDDHLLRAYINGLTTLPFDRLRLLSDALGLEFPVILEAWLADCLPEFLQTPEIMMVTPDERRLLERVRRHYAGNAASLVVADGRDLVAVVMA